MTYERRIYPNGFIADILLLAVILLLDEYTFSIARFL